MAASDEAADLDLREEAVLRVAMELAGLELRGFDLPQAIDVLRGRGVPGADPILQLLPALQAELTRVVIVELSPNELVPGLLLGQDLVGDGGVLLARRGYEMTEGFVERLRNLPRGRLPGRIAVVDPVANARARLQ